MSFLTIPRFTSHVTVIGDVMLDRYWSGPAARISPEAPVPVVRVTQTTERPGGAANVALNIAALEAPCSLIGIVGCDEAAGRLRECLHRQHVDTAFAACADHPTITKLRVMSRNQQLLRLDFEEGFAGMDHAPLLSSLRRCLPQTQAVICSDYGKGALHAVQDMIAMARDAGVAVLVDPKGRDFARYRGATLLTPNLQEFEAVAGPAADDAELVARARDLIEALELQALIITRSEDGMTLVRRGREPVHLPTRAREVYDVTGAGDTVIAVLAAALASGMELVSACELANRAAGIVVGKLGTSSVSPRELREDLARSASRSYGIVTQDVLLERIAELRSLGRRIIMTNGCFDILHRGHVEYLRRARALGDILIVAVNDDASVRRLKGSRRPVIPLDSRMCILEALACVDYVVAFAEDTPERLIAAILPDVLVKGGDYTVEQIAGHRQVLEAGGQVITLPLVAGHSTSGIIERISAAAQPERT